MPILDTVVLFAAADAGDRFHRDSLGRLGNASKETMLGTFALLEFDLVLKSRGSTAEQRSDLMVLLLKDFANIATAIHSVSPSTIAIAAQLESRFGLDYFDALLASESMEHDGIIVSTDREFEKIPGLKRIPLASKAKA